MKLEAPYKPYKWIERDKKGRTEASKEGFYTTKKWIKLRDYKLSINPICEHCKAMQHRYTKAKIVDHIEAIQDVNDVKAYDVNNLQSLCEYHHQRKTRLDNSKYNPQNLKAGQQIQDDLNDFET